MAYTGFHDPEILAAVSSQHVQGHAHLVIVVLVSFVRLSDEGKHIEEKLLHSCFSGCAGQGDNPAPEALPPGTGRGAEGLHRIVHHEHGHLRMPGGEFRNGTLRQHGAGSVFNGLHGKIVSVHPFSGYADEERARNGPAAVRDYRGNDSALRIRRDSGPAGLGYGFQTQTHLRIPCFC